MTEMWTKTFIFSRGNPYLLHGSKWHKVKLSEVSGKGNKLFFFRTYYDKKKCLLYFYLTHKITLKKKHDNMIICHWTDQNIKNQCESTTLHIIFEEQLQNWRRRVFQEFIYKILYIALGIRLVFDKVLSIFHSLILQKCLQSVL